jgi:NADPH-dependent 2,4-dienoyl-CoA reductase/sulfur reductase-like enzyme
MPDRRDAEIVVIGAGPAGLAATVTADEARRRVLVVHDAAYSGGQIWRRDVVRKPPTRAQHWLRRVEQTTASWVDGATVIDVRTIDATHLVTVERDGRAAEFAARRVILATGARELFLPFPGWTLPGVLGVGAAQAMAKGGLDMRGKRVVIAGSGPLLVAVAASLARRGARIVMVAEQASLKRMIGFGARLFGAPRIALDAIGYMSAVPPKAVRFGTWVVGADGDDRVRQVSVTNGASRQTIDCDLLCVGYGLVPNTELAQLFGCEVTAHGIVVSVNQETTVPGVYAAGECVGIAGVDAALAEGAIAGFAAADMPDRSAPYRRRRAVARSWGRRLESTFALRPELLALAAPDTIVCRCEDVRFGDVDRAWSARQAKLYARIGMGPCQGRVCGPALAKICGWTPDRIRAPVYPSFLSSLSAPQSPRDTPGAT